MNLIQQAFQKLYPEKEFGYSVVLKYSGKFRGYNARVQLNRSSGELAFRLSKKWVGVSDEIQIGLVQSLLVKILKSPAHSVEMDLYELFIKNLPDVLPRTKTNVLLEDSFKRVNQQYFDGLMAMPNFELKDSLRVLGTYEYSTDTVSITRLLLDKVELLDYVMYHELLHKKHKFSSVNNRCKCHTPAFRNDEKKFANADFLEKQLNAFVNRNHAMKKVKKFFSFF